MIKTNVISVETAIANGFYTWGKSENDCDFYGIIPGFVCGFCLEATNGIKTDYSSCIFTNDFDAIKIPNIDENWNELGIMAELVECNGYKPTGNLVFRGYFGEQYDYDYLEVYYTDASDIVLRGLQNMSRLKRNLY